MGISPRLGQILGEGVSVNSFFDAHQIIGYGSGAPASATWPAADRAIAVPFRRISPWPLRQLYWLNGTIVGTVHLDCGVYIAGADGSLTSQAGWRTGSTTQTGDSAVQTVDIADVSMPPGLFFMALVMDANSSGVFRSAAAVAAMRAIGCVQMASAFPLPATFTPAAIASGYHPVFGVSTKATGV